MRDYILNRDENGMVRYLYGKDKRYPYVGKTKWESARWMLENDRSRELRMSEEFEGFPLTADGVYYFDGALAVGESEVEATSSGTEARDEGVGTSSDPGGAGATFPKGEGSGETEETAPVCGPDWCEIPEVAEKPKRKRAAKKAREVVGE